MVQGSLSYAPCGRLPPSPSAPATLAPHFTLGQLQPYVWAFALAVASTWYALPPGVGMATPLPDVPCLGYPEIEF